MALIPASARDVTREEERAELAVRRREAREKTHYRDVWTKLPHGGAYVKASCKVSAQSHNALSQRMAPDTSSTWPEWVQAGYEVVKVGATTNIVGDAMSQGAVDLVRAELSSPDTMTSGIASALAPHWSQVSAKRSQLDPQATALDEQEDMPEEHRCRMDALAPWMSSKECSCEQCWARKQRADKFQALWARLKAQGKVPVSE